MTLCNMAAELGAQAGLVAPDEVTRQWLREMRARPAVAPAQAGAAEVPEAGPKANLEADLEVDFSAWRSDEGAPGRWHQFDASGLAPQIALPHSPANSRAVGDLEPVRIDVAYIGACTGAKLEDLRAAARVLSGRRVAAGVQLMVAPASVRDAQAAQAEGVMDTLREAGATLLPSSCGACAGYGGRIPEGSTVISSTARNFKGRMGAASAQVFLGSPYTVAASALRGWVTDPREVLA
jgi:3-isopropylmalate/(R)-2-methylmalate dehydratase large subunit